jgi:hypothetical protein
MGLLEERAEAISGEFDSDDVSKTLWAYETMEWKSGTRLMGLLKERPEAIKLEPVLKEAWSILNKLTWTNFDKLSNDLAHLDISEPDELWGLVSIIFDRALEEGFFCKTYAELCNCIKNQM